MTAPRLDQGQTVDLLNTVWADRAGQYDELADARLAGRWLETDLSESATTQLRDLRDALRVLAADRTADPRPVASAPGDRVAESVATVNATSALAPSWPVLVDGRAEQLTRGPPDDRLLGGLAAAAIEFLASAPELRACLAPGCVLYFVKDHPRRTWCSTGCGNRVRAARHYARRRTT
jgi:predicted RNA-binding Zn ribbon-like protein